MQDVLTARQSFGLTAKHVQARLMPNVTMATETSMASATMPPVDFVVFDGCFGRLHRPAPAATVARGVVLCNAFGHEALWTARALKDLAEMLATAGLSVLRFDYPGTGDSAGVPAPGQIARWVASIDAAATFLRRQTGFDEVILCGLRLGALLALLAAADMKHRAAGLAMIAPPSSGKALLREMAMLRQLLGVEAGHAAVDDPDTSEFYGFPLFGQDCADLAAIIPAEHLRRLPSSRRLALGAPRSLSPDCEALPFPGMSALMRSAELAVTPTEDFKHLVRWIGKDAEHARYAGAVDAAPVLVLPEARESFLAFGKDRSLFGALSTPNVAVSVGAGPAVLVLNTGATPHIGHGRLAVEISRDLAKSGIAALRIDVTGLGDSSAPTLAVPPGDTRLAERARAFDPRYPSGVRDALALLEDAGHAPIVLFGICSGASLALQAAADPRVAAALLVNLPNFAADNALAPVSSGYAQAVGLMRRAGGSKQASRLAASVRGLADSLRRLMATLAGGGAAGRLVNPALRRLHRLTERGVVTRLLYDAADPGLAKLTRWLGPAPSLADWPNTSCRIVHDAGHVFAGSQDRKLLFDELRNLVLQRC